ncbi:MAG: dihydrodipicolinate synthase family protein [Christensenellales bacterium]|jgi:dihydrodipicolinate synthase/N-acetylneuraminate lyase
MNIRKQSLYGVVCASVCPMNEDGSVDYEGVKNLTRHLIDDAIHCLYPNGTNGESLSLTQEERFKVAETVNTENASQAVLYIQCGSSNVEESYKHVRHSAKIGVDGVGLMNPVFFMADEESQRQYFDKILNEMGDFPIYAYNIPTRTGNDLSPKLLGDLASLHSNLYGIKYSYPDILRMEHYVDCCPGRHISVLVGNDSLAIACYMIGGDGWVSGPSAVFPKRHVQLYEALKAFDMKKAREIQYRIMRTADAMSDIPEIPAIKYMLVKMGIIRHDTCRSPLRPLTSIEKVRLDVIIDDYLTNG